jgi:hypothetical protein
MMSDDLMRSFMLLAEALGDEGSVEEELLVEAAQPEPRGTIGPVLMHDLSEVVFRLRGFMETSGGEYALGVETGMQRAADMIENLIRRHGEGDDQVG